MFFLDYIDQLIKVQINCMGHILHILPVFIYQCLSSPAKLKQLKYNTNTLFHLNLDSSRVDFYKSSHKCFRLEEEQAEKISYKR